MFKLLPAKWLVILTTLFNYVFRGGGGLVASGHSSSGSVVRAPARALFFANTAEWPKITHVLP